MLFFACYVIQETPYGLFRLKIILENIIELVGIELKMFIKYI